MNTTRGRTNKCTDRRSRGGRRDRQRTEGAAQWCGHDDARRCSRCTRDVVLIAPKFIGMKLGGVRACTHPARAQGTRRLRGASYIVRRRPVCSLRGLGDPASHVARGSCEGMLAVEPDRLGARLRCGRDAAGATAPCSCCAARVRHSRFAHGPAAVRAAAKSCDGCIEHRYTQA